MELLTKDVTVLIFSFLNIEELGKVTLVCSQWKAFAEDDYIWRFYCKDFEFKQLPKGCETWKQAYIKYGAKILKWKWNPEDRDAAIVLSENDMQATRKQGGHNPSVRATTPCAGVASYYFEVEAKSIGDWFSFGFATMQFGVSSGNHTGKGIGSCAYYSDSGTHSIFSYGQDEKKVSAISEGSRIGCLLDLRKGVAQFYLDGKLEATASNTDWSNEERSEPVLIYPVLSIGVSAIVEVVPHPKLPKPKVIDDCELFL